MPSLSFPPQQPRVCSTRRQTALRWEAFHSEGNAWSLALACWNVPCLRPFCKKWLCILHLNIIIHGQSLLAVGTDCSFRIFKVRASLLFLWHSCLHWITVENIFLAYLSAFAGVSFMNPDSSQCRAPTCSTLVCVFGAWYEISIWCKRKCAHASSHIFMYIQYHKMGSTDNFYALIGDRSFAWVQAKRPTQL